MVRLFFDVVGSLGEASNEKNTSGKGKIYYFHQILETLKLLYTFHYTS